MTAGPYSIGSRHWPGLSKVIEECGEVIQAAGKIIAANGDGRHWDGSDLRQRLEDELADAQSAIAFAIDVNGLDSGRMLNRTADKLVLFRKWHEEHSDGTALPGPGEPSPYSAACSGCGQGYADEESGAYLFASRERLERLLHADGWRADPVLCPACQPDAALAGEEPGDG